MTPKATLAAIAVFALADAACLVPAREAKRPATATSMNTNAIRLEQRTLESTGRGLGPACACPVRPMDAPWDELESPVGGVRSTSCSAACRWRQLDSYVLRSHLSTNGGGLRSPDQEGPDAAVGKGNRYELAALIHRAPAPFRRVHHRVGPPRPGTAIGWPYSVFPAALLGGLRAQLQGLG